MKSIVFLGVDKFNVTLESGTRTKGYYAGGFIYIGGFPAYCPDWPNLPLGAKMAKIWQALGV